MRSNTFILWLTSFIAAVVALETTNDPIHTNLKHIATADGKAFFVEMTPGRHWGEARTYCESQGLKLATITSMAQAEALANAYSGAFYSDCWINAMDKTSIEQFNWDATNSPVELFSTGYFYKISGEMSSLAIQPVGDGTAHFRNWAYGALLGTLCQTA